jgi:hypothetical protein
MKLERLHEYVTIVVTVVFGMLLAVYMGTSTGSGASTPIIIVGGIIATMIALVMRSNIWLLIPICWPLKGSVGVIPGDFPLYDLAILYVFPVFLALKALKIVRAKFQYNWLDYLLLLNFVYLLTVFIRHPAGTMAMNLERVQGKPYYDILIISLGYWVLGHITITPKEARKLPFLLFFGDLFSATLGFITYHFPFTVPIVCRFYTGISTQGYNADMALSSTDSLIEREEYLGPFAEKLAGLLCSNYSPTSLLNPLRLGRFLLFIVVIVATLRSGFRSILLDIGLIFLLSSYFRGEIEKGIYVLLSFIPVLVLMIGAQGSLVQLPVTMQRALSFLPGEWSHEAVDDAEGSTEWRVGIWKQVWDKRNHYIRDWYFGDGFGCTKEQQEEFLRLEYTNDPNLRDTQTVNLLVGHYHSLPLSTIHIVGYVGLTLFTLLSFSMATYGWKVVKASRETPYFPIALFMGIPIILAPLEGFLIYGDFYLDFMKYIFWIGMIRIVGRSLEQYLTQKAEEEKTSRAFPELRLNRFPQPHTL